LSENEKNKSSLIYCIPNPTDKKYLDDHFLTQLKNIISDDQKMIENSKLIVGCKIIAFENKFTEILDSAYKSFLLGMYYSTVTLTVPAAERMCYDLIAMSQIKYNERLLDNKQKESLYRIPYSEILKFLFSLDEFDKEIKDNLFKINETRHKYVHPQFSEDPFIDAKNTLNLLCKTIDLIIMHRNK